MDGELIVIKYVNLISDLADNFWSGAITTYMYQNVVNPSIIDNIREWFLVNYQLKESKILFKNSVLNFQVEAVDTLNEYDAGMAYARNVRNTLKSAVNKKYIRENRTYAELHNYL